MQNYYSILEISASASNSEIKSAFRRLSKIYHPDKNGNEPLYEEKFKILNEAYSCLINPQKRKQFDEQLRNYIGNNIEFESKEGSFVKSVFNVAAIFLLLIFLFNAISFLFNERKYKST